MRPWLETEFGNAASSGHDWGHRAGAAVERARDSVARFLGVKPGEVIFTAGATEADNLAVKGGARAARAAGKGEHLVTTAIEHHAVLESVEALEREGFTSTVVYPGADGIVPPEAIADAIEDDTVLVSVMAANGEIGTLQPVAEIGALCRERGVLFHSDATQMIGKLPFDASLCDLASVSAHKFHGPKGVGALTVRDGVEIEPLFSGGGQERGLRSGTLNVPGIVGLGAVCDLRSKEMEAEAVRVRALRDRLWGGIRERIPEAHLNGSLEHRLPGNLNVSFARCDGEALLTALRGFALSTGSACQSGVTEPSAVLLALDVPPNLARGSLRFGLGGGNTEAEIDALLGALAPAVERLRALAPEPA
jgi:cysteine desulfurase